MCRGASVVYIMLTVEAHLVDRCVGRRGVDSRWMMPLSDAMRNDLSLDMATWLGDQARARLP